MPVSAPSRGRVALLALLVVCSACGGDAALPPPTGETGSGLPDTTDGDTDALGGDAPGTNADTGAPDASDEDTDASDDASDEDTADSGPPDAPVDPPPDPSAAVFDTTLIHRIDLTLDAAAWAEIRDTPWAKTWHSADFALDGVPVPDVGVRAYGRASLVAGKPSLKLSFDRFVDGREFLGLEELKLDASAQDPGFLNEAIATGVLRELGLPAARTGWAVVFVNGERAGLFVVLESIDDEFIKRRFGRDDGVLYSTRDGMYAQGLNRFTSTRPFDWYEVEFGGGDGSDIEAAADAIAFGTREQLEAVVDVETSMRVSATRAIMGGTDSFVACANNFYLYSDRGRIVTLPWDHDLELGGLGVVLFNMVTMDLRRPWESSHWRPNSITGESYTEPLYARMLAEGWDLDGWVRTVTAGPLAWSTVDAQVRAWAALIESDACNDTLHSCESFGRRLADLRFFLHARLSRLAGRDVAGCSGRTELDFTPAAGSANPLVDAMEWAPGFTVDGEHHCTGLFAHAPSELVTTVTAGRFTGAVGLHDGCSEASDGVRFSLWQGDTPVWTSDVVEAYHPAVPFSVPVVAGELRLVTEPLADPYCDWSVWLDLAVE